jgi:hypothetical protein
MDPVVQVEEISLQVRPVILPRRAINAGGRTPLKGVV